MGKPAIASRIYCGVIICTKSGNKTRLLFINTTCTIKSVPAAVAVEEVDAAAPAFALCNCSCPLNELEHWGLEVDNTTFLDPIQYPIQY